MADDFVTLATFPTPVEAGFVRNLLEAEGIRAYLADEMTAGMLWQLSNTIGWVKLRVASSDFARANEVLEEHHQTVADLGPEAFAEEATSTAPAEETVATTGVVVCPGCGRESSHDSKHCWMCGASLEGVPIRSRGGNEALADEKVGSDSAEADDDVENPIDEVAARAFRAAGIGLIFFPLLFYAAWLIGRLVVSKAELSDRASRLLWLAFFIAAAGFTGYWMLLIFPILHGRPI
jgi:hypothetical protein